MIHFTSTSILRDRGEDRGLTLIELLIAMMILGILLVIVSGLYVSSMQTVSLSRSLTDNTKSVSNAMNEASRVIRAGTANPIAGQPLSAPAFVSAKNEEVILYAYINLGSSAQQPVMIRLKLDSERNFVESRWPATPLGSGNWSFPDPTTTPEWTRVLAGTVSPNVVGQPRLFTYLLSNGTVLPVPTSGTFTDDERRSIASVQITLTVQPSLTDATHPVTLQNTVGIPNLGLARVG